MFKPQVDVKGMVVPKGAGLLYLHVASLLGPTIPPGVLFTSPSPLETNQSFFGVGGKAFASPLELSPQGQKTLLLSQERDPGELGDGAAARGMTDDFRGGGCGDWVGSSGVTLAVERPERPGLATVSAGGGVAAVWNDFRWWRRCVEELRLGMVAVDAVGGAKNEPEAAMLGRGGRSNPSHIGIPYVWWSRVLASGCEFELFG